MLRCLSKCRQWSQGKFPITIITYNFVNSEISTFEAGEHEDVVVGVPKI